MLRGSSCWQDHEREMDRAPRVRRSVLEHGQRAAAERLGDGGHSTRRYENSADGISIRNTGCRANWLSGATSTDRNAKAYQPESSPSVHDSIALADVRIGPTTPLAIDRERRDDG